MEIPSQRPVLVGGQVNAMLSRSTPPVTGRAGMAADAAVELRQLANLLAAAAAGDAGAAAEVLDQIDSRRGLVGIRVELFCYLVDLVNGNQTAPDGSDSV